MVDHRNCLQAAIFFQQLEHQAGEVPAVGRWRVVHGTIIRMGGVIEHHRLAVNRLANQVVTHNHYRQPGRADVFLCTRIDNAILTDINRPRQNG